MKEIKVKYVDLPLQFNSIREEVVPKVLEVLESGNFIFGTELENFEKKFAKYCNCTYAVGVANGTDAIWLSLKSMGIGTGDEVITAPNSFIASAGAIAATGAKPVFVDVKEDFNINPEAIEKAITNKTKAIIPIHLTGRAADMAPIMTLAKKYDLKVIEDAAQSVGAMYYGKKVGSFGDVGCFSLHPLKNLNACGDAGIITTNDKSIYETLIKMRNHGLKNRNECEFWAYNSRLDSIQAAILNIKLRYLGKWNERIREIAAMYKGGLSSWVTVPSDQHFEYCVYHTFIIQCDARDKLQEYLLNQGVETKIHYPIPLHLQESAKILGYDLGDFPMTEKQSKKILSLPIYPELTNEQIQIVINDIQNFYRNQTHLQ